MSLETLQFQSRLRGKFEALNEAETDMAFHPLMIKKANREYYSIKEYEKFNKREKILYAIAPHPGHVTQYSELNGKIESSEHHSQKRSSKIFFYTPNLSLISENMNGSIFYQLRGETTFQVSKRIPYFIKADSREQQATYQLRGFETRGMKPVATDTWLSVNPLGTEIAQVDKEINHLEAAGAFLKRIPSIHLAREIFMDRYFLKSLDISLDRNALASDHGIGYGMLRIDRKCF